MYHLVARGIYIRWQHLILLFIYIVQLYKEDWGILRMLGCRAVALPSTEQIVYILFLRSMQSLWRDSRKLLVSYVYHIYQCMWLDIHGSTKHLISVSMQSMLLSIVVGFPIVLGTRNSLTFQLFFLLIFQDTYVFTNLESKEGDVFNGTCQSVNVITLEMS